MKLYNGIDIVNIQRKEFDNINLVDHVLTPNELNYYNKNSNIDKRKMIATFWAIKEAIFKAVKGNTTFKKIEIKKINNQYYEAICNNLIFNVSTSFEEPYIIAHVLAFD